MYRTLAITTILLTTLLFSGNLKAQEETIQELTPRQLRKAQREAMKKIEEQQARMAFEQGVAALKEKSFAVEVDQLIYPRGYAKYVSTITNFIYMEKGKAVIQISVSNFFPGPNGVGGITVEGIPSDITLSTDKRGNISYDFMVQGVGVSAMVNIQLPEGGERVSVYIYPNFYGRSFTMTGRLVPFSKSVIFKGHSL